MKQIVLTQGKKVIVDNDTYEKYGNIKFYAAKSKNFFYARNNDLGYLHNLVLGKPVSKRWQVKFKNGNTLNCRKNNLMFIRHSDNTQSKSKLQKNRRKTSKYLGVSHVNYYAARIKFDGKVLNIGKYRAEKEAALAYNIRARQLFGENAKVNILTKKTTYHEDS